MAAALALCAWAASASSDGGVEAQAAGLKHLASGTLYYWLLKDPSGLRSVSTSGWAGPDAGLPTRTETGATRCAPVRLTAGPSVARLDLQSDGFFGAARFHATFALKEVKGSWRLLVASVSDPRLGITLPARCTLSFEERGGAVPDGGVATGAGPRCCSSTSTGSRASTIAVATARATCCWRPRGRSPPPLPGRADFSAASTRSSTARPASDIAAQRR